MLLLDFRLQLGQASFGRSSMEVEEATAAHLSAVACIAQDTVRVWLCAQLQGVDECGVSGIGGCEAGGGDVVAHTFTGSCTMMMSTNGEDGTLASKLYQQHQQAAPPCSPSTS